ncbi:MAG: nitronate monooxygenase [Candidatus Eremiobacteraeota bacterium]|nr:nitronate monooxygenase [Candidatus Eremiobacteraeota bacterium]
MRTALTDLLRLRHPIVSAPMTPQSGGLLAGTVSRSGALGMFGFDESESPESLRHELDVLRETAQGESFGIGLVRWVLDLRPDLINVAIEAKPTIVSISFGDPEPYVRRFHEAGILVAAQVQSKAWAEVALEAGCDLIVAQGTEAGGHTGGIGTLPLLQIVLELHGTAPVIAAGGIATGRGLAASLAAGAAGVWIGTPFLAALEARTNPDAVRTLVAADETQTILTSAFDRALHRAWPPEFRGRALRNDFSDAWHGREDQITPDTEAELAKARAERNYRVAHLYAGQTVGFVKAREPAEAIVARVASDGERYLRAACALLK